MVKKRYKHRVTRSQYVNGLCYLLHSEKDKRVQRAVKHCLCKIIEEHTKYIPSCNSYLESVVHKHGTTVARLECNLQTLCPIVRLYSKEVFVTTAHYTHVTGHARLSRYMCGEIDTPSGEAFVTDVKIWFAESSFVELKIENVSETSLCMRSCDNGVRWVVERINRTSTHPDEIRISLDYLFLYTKWEQSETSWFHKDATCKRFVHSYLRAMMDLCIYCAPHNCKITFRLRNKATIPKQAPFQSTPNALEGVNLTALRVCQGLPDLYESLGFYTTKDVQHVSQRRYNTRCCLSAFEDHRQTYELRKYIMSTTCGGDKYIQRHTRILDLRSNNTKSHHMCE